MNELGIERLSVFGLPPVAFVRLTAELGCRRLGMAPAPMPGAVNPHGYPDWSLREDPALRRELLAAMRDTGVRIGVFEGLAITTGLDVRDLAPDLDLAAELDAARINLVSLDEDRSRTFDGFARATEMAAARGIAVTSEVGTMLSLPAALEAAKHVARPDFQLLIDTMHFFRLGWTLEDFARLDPALIGYVQLCDAPWRNRFATYREEALYERLAPGAGELPLAGFVRLIPSDVVVSLEIPQRSLAEAGVSPRDRLRPCVEAARAMLGGG